MPELISIDSMKKERDEYLKKAHALSVVIELYERKEKPIKKDSVAGKIISIIEEEGRFLYRNEILDLQSKHNVAFKGDIRATLSYAAKDEKCEIVSKKHKSNLYLWGLRSFLDENGEILPERMFVKNEKYERKN